MGYEVWSVYVCICKYWNEVNKKRLNLKVGMKCAFLIITCKYMWTRLASEGVHEHIASKLIESLYYYAIWDYGI